MSYAYPRSRSRGALDGPSWAIDQDTNFVTCANRVPNYFHYVGAAGFGERTTFDDFVVPGFDRRKSKGEFFFNPFSKETRRVLSFGTSNMTFTSIANACTGPNLKEIIHESGQHLTCILVEGYSGATFNYPSLFTNTECENLGTETKTQCMARRRGGETNLVESLAEMHQAMALFGAPLSNVRKFVKDFSSQAHSRGKARFYLRRGKAFVELATSEYLRFRYGIQPLIRDVGVVLKTMKETYDIGPKLHTARASGAMSKTAVANLSYSIGRWIGTYQKTSKHDFSVRAMWVDKYQRSPLDKLGLTYQNLIGLPWELTRYSFVVDWFVNLGDLLYANIPRVGLTPLGGTVSVVDERRNVYSPTGNTPPTGYTMTGGVGDSAENSRLQKYRQLNDGNTDLVIKTDFGLNGWTRALDAVSLTLQILNRISFVKNIPRTQRDLPSIFWDL